MSEDSLQFLLKPVSFFVGVAFLIKRSALICSLHPSPHTKCMLAPPCIYIIGSKNKTAGMYCCYLQGSSCIAVDSGLEEGHCGLVPVGGACSSCTTTGLTWNLGILLIWSTAIFSLQIIYSESEYMYIICNVKTIDVCITLILVAAIVRT